MNLPVSPSRYSPKAFAELIGPAAGIGRVMQGKIARIKADPDAVFKGMYYGCPGVGKTELARLIALALGELKPPTPKELAMSTKDRIKCSYSIEEVSGVQVNVEMVKGWMNSAGVGGLFGDWQVKLIHEMDRIPTTAQDLLLQYLDIIPGKRAFVGTSNLQLDLLQERFQTRMQTWKVEAPSTEEITEFIMRWEIPRQIAAMIAVGCGGNVRAALLDTESHLDVQLAA